MMNPKAKKNEERNPASKGKRPDYTGTVSDMNQSQTGKVALWQTTEKRNPNFPDLTGTLTTNDNTKYRIAIWKRTAV